MKQIYVWLITLFCIVGVSAQTTVISPTGAGSFEGASFAADGWTTVQGTAAANNNLAIGNAATIGFTPTNGTKGVFVTTDGTTRGYNTAAASWAWIYKDVTLNAGETINTFTMDLFGNPGDTGYDGIVVGISDTTLAGSITTGATGTMAATLVPGLTIATTATSNTFIEDGSYATATNRTFVFSAAALGNASATVTKRIWIGWRCDGSVGTTGSPMSFDRVNMVTRAPGTFISIVSGNWSSATTWDANAVPTVSDNAVVSTGHTVTIDATGQTIKDLAVNGILTYGTTPTTFAVTGNLTVASGGALNAFNGTTGKNISVAGNLTNNGTIDLSVGTTGVSLLTLNGTTVQTVSGSGTFTSNIIRNLTFNNTNAALPNINWNMSGLMVGGTLTFTAGKVALGSKLTLGSGTATGTGALAIGALSYTAGGFTSGTFNRYWALTGNGTTITAAADPTAVGGRYPFISEQGINRSAFIDRTGTLAAGQLSCTYVNAIGTSTVSVVDGTYTVDTRYNSNWTFSLEGSAYAGTNEVALMGSSSYPATNGNSRVLLAAAAAGGTHQAGTVTPGAQRIMTPAELTAGALYMGISNADAPFASVTSGDWSNATTWNKGTVPTCTDVIQVFNGHTVTVNSASNVAKNITVVAGGTLTIASGDLTVGCTLNNNPLNNNGTIIVNGGTLNINGNLSSNAGSTFTQNGGDVILDGSDGTTANSVVTTTPLVRFIATAPSNLNLTAGTFTIVDPHYGVATTDYSLSINQAGAYNTANANHTFKFGNGISTTAGGNTNGFYINSYVGTYIFGLGTLVVDALTGTNRFVKGSGSIIVSGNATVTSGELQLPSNSFFAGNITNNGTVTSLASIVFSGYLGTAVIPTTMAQTIGGTGVFRNLAAAPTANLTTMVVNNSSTSGVTLNVPLSISGTLTLTQGFVNTTATNLLTLGTATLAGTLAGGSTTTYIKGPFARTIASGNANTAFVVYPVGKTAYNPISLAPATTAVTVMKAEAFDTNTGTSDASITALSAKRWEAPVVSGTVTTINVKLGDAAIAATNVIAQGTAAAGVYNAPFGITPTYAAGTPNTLQSTTPLASASYTGFLSYATSNACSGTPAPGATTATSSTVCSGQSTTLSIANVPAGTGVTYQWQESANGTTYTDVTAGTTQNLVVTPTAAMYYQCIVTCTTSAATATSTPLQITFTNNITSTTPGARCGTGTVSLAAVASSGTPTWYSSATSTAVLGTGSPFVTPSISANTNYYVAAESISSATYNVGPATDVVANLSSLGAYGMYLSSTNAATINTVDIYPSTAGTLNVTLKNTAGTTIVTQAFTIVAGEISTSAKKTLALTGFNVPANSTGWTLNYDLAINRGGGTYTYPYTSNGFSITGNTIDGNNITGGTRMYFYNWNVTSTTSCASPRVAVTATVNTPPAFTLSSNTATICSGLTSTPAITITAGAADYDTYVWSPIAGVTGSAAAGWVFNPTASTTYTLTASQSTGSMCTTTATVNVTVNQTPSAIVVTPSPTSVCNGDIKTLVATGGTIVGSGSSTVGTATTLSTTTTEPTAFCNRWKHYLCQMVFTAAELNAVGIQAGNINSLKFNISSLGDGTNVTDFRVKIGTTTASTLSTYTTTGLTEVFSAATYSHTVGVNTITFTTPYAWDGISNLIVDLRQTGADALYNAETYYTATAGNTALSSRTSTVYASSDAYAATSPAPTASTNRLNTTFGWTSNTPTTITWSPVTDLYTDAAATTTPYTAGTNAATVYVKSTTAGTTTYTVTATSPLNCTSTNTVSVTVNPVTTAPTGAATQTFCNSATVASLAATGTGVQWYAASTGGTALATTTALVDATHYYATQTVNSCESATRLDVTVVISTPATPVVSTTSATCAAEGGATVTNYVATDVYTFSPTGPTVGTGGVVSGATAGTAYTVTATTGTCVSAASASFTTAAMLATPATPVVSTTSATCAAAGGATVTNYVATDVYTFSPTGPTVGTGGVVSGATAGTPYTVTATTGTCVSATSASFTTAAMLATPATPVVSTTSATCAAAGSATVTNYVATDVYTFSPTGPTVGTGGVVSGATAGTAYTVTATTGTCVSAASASFTTAAMLATPATPVVSTTSATCAAAGGATVTNYVATDVYTFSPTGPTVGTGGVVSGATAGTAYTVTATTGTCVSAASASFTTAAMTVTPAPTGASAQTFCAGETVSMINVTGTGIIWYTDATGTTVVSGSTVLVSGTTYYASQTVGCESNTRLAVTMTLGTCLGTKNVFDSSSFSYYPNPVKDMLNLKYSNTIDSVTVISITGQQLFVKKFNTNEVQVEMSNLPTGTYIMNITSGDQMKTIKVIKE